LSLILFIFFI